MLCVVEVHVHLQKATAVFSVAHVQYTYSRDSHAPLNLPDPAHDPIAFTEIILGIDWIDDLEAQAFLIQFITDLKQKRSELLINQP